MTVSSLSPTFLSLFLPSSISFLRVRTSSLYLCTSSLYLRTSASASSRPSTARFRAASAFLRSRCLLWEARVLNWLILSLTELSRECPFFAGEPRLLIESRCSEPTCMLRRSEETGSKGAMLSAAKVEARLDGEGVVGAGVDEPSRVDGRSMLSCHRRLAGVTRWSAGVGCGGIRCRGKQSNRWRWEPLG